MIEVFKTNVDCPDKARSLLSILSQHYPGHRINFDLQDCDRVLRIEGNQFTAEHIQSLLSQNGFACDILE